MSANGQFQHLDPILGRSQFPLLLVGRNRGRHEPYGVQLSLFAATFRQEQVTEVYGIETAAEDADTHNLKARKKNGIVRMSKSEIRMSKSETNANSNEEIPSTKRRVPVRVSVITFLVI